MKLFKRTEEQQADRDVAAATMRVEKLESQLLSVDAKLDKAKTKQQRNLIEGDTLTDEALAAGTTNIGVLEGQKTAVQAALEVVKQDRDHAKSRLEAIHDERERNIAAQRHDELADLITTRAASFAVEAERFEKSLVGVRHLQAENLLQDVHASASRAVNTANGVARDLHFVAQSLRDGSWPPPVTQAQSPPLQEATKSSDIRYQRGLSCA